MKIFLILLLSLFLSACHIPDHPAMQGETVPIVDSQGRELDLPKEAEPVAIFDFALLNIYQALGLEDRVALTAANPLPHYLEETYAHLDSAGSLHDLDIEETVTLYPELALVATRSSAQFDALNQYLPTADFSLSQPTTFDSLAYNMTEISKIYGLEERAKSLLHTLDEDRKALAQDAQKQDLNAIMILYNQGELSAYGPASRFGQIYDDFGFPPADSQIEASNHGMPVSYEYLVELNPDIIFVLDRETAVNRRVSDSQHARSNFEQHPLVSQLCAKAKGRLYYVTPDAWYLANGGYQAFEIMMADARQAIE